MRQDLILICMREPVILKPAQMDSLAQKIDYTWGHYYVMYSTVLHCTNDDLTTTNGLATPADLTRNNILTTPDHCSEGQLSTLIDYIWGHYYVMYSTVLHCTNDDLTTTNGLNTPNDLTTNNGLATPDDLARNNVLTTPDDLTTTNGLDITDGLTTNKG